MEGINKEQALKNQHLRCWSPYSEPGMQVELQRNVSEVHSREEGW